MINKRENTDSKTNFNRLTSALKIASLIATIIFIQSISCFADVPCTDCCLIPGGYDGIAPNKDYYKDKGGLRQTQRLVRVWASTTCRDSEEEIIAFDNSSVDKGVDKACREES